MSDKETRKFIASSELFSDFTVEISLYNVESLEDIIKIFVTELRECLIKNNFKNLVEQLDKKNFHIHGKTIEMILVSNDTESFFICDHEYS
tara:strand:+ start:1562 stop:1834 length:273 start_codon:yes stop_codon:yes gene_type:complete